LFVAEQHAYPIHALLGMDNKSFGALQGMGGFYRVGGTTYYQMVNQTDRNEKGRFESGHDVSSEDVFEAMEIHNPYTTGELADELDIPRRTAYKYLEQLADEDRILKKKPEPRRVIWMRGG